MFISGQEQLEKIAPNMPFVASLYWNNFGRKNVGYLYAISRGAKVIYDFDDDNELIYWLEGASLEPNTNLDFFAFSDHGKFNAIYLTFS